MRKSKYLDRFKRLWSEDTSLFILHDNRLLVEILPKEELKSKGGLILAAPKADHRSATEENQHQLAIVLYVGSGTIDDKGSVIAPSYSPGNLILVSPFSLRPYTSFPMLNEYTANDIALTRDVDVHCSFRSEEDYLKACAILNGAGV